MTREERTYIRLAIDQETRRRNLPAIRLQVEKGPSKRATRSRRNLPKAARRSGMAGSA